MRAITLWQPWAQLIVIGDKSVETRHWSTKVRGEIAIHAAQRKAVAFFPQFDDFDMPFGAVVGTAEIIDCLPFDKLYGSVYDTPAERSYGDWTAGRFGWVLRNPQLFSEPIPAKGRQGFWIWDEK